MPDVTTGYATDDGRPLVVLCAGSGWTGIAGTDRRMAEALAAHARILWVDPPVSPLTPAPRRLGMGRFPRPRLVAALPGILRLTPVALPGHTRPGIEATTGPLVRMQIRRALHRLGVKPHAVIACSLADVLSGWGPGVIRVLYGTDDYAAGAELMGLSRAVLLRDEQRQIANADIVVAISQPLADRWSAMGAKVLLIPNGVEADAYRDIEAAAPAGDVRLPPPVAGVIGQFSARIDIAMLEAVAASGCSLLLVGPHDPGWEPERFAALVRRDRVAWVGRREFGELPSYLRVMDVGLTPYADSPFNRASFPLKTLEYLAAGLPVVSTDLPATRWLACDLIRVATGPETFAQAAREAAGAESSAGLVAQRKAFAARHSWQNRAAELSAAIGLAGPAR